MRTDILSRKDEVVRMVEANEPKSSICRLLGCKPITLNSYLSKMGITYEGNMGMKGKKQDGKRKTAAEYLSSGSAVQSSKLRKKLIEDGVKKGECEMCGCSSWFGFPLKLELHHMDGDHYNNDLGNLQILCPNCHSLTPNHSRRKKVSEAKEMLQKKEKTVTRKREGVFEKMCKGCGDEFSNSKRIYCSVECFDKVKQSRKPDKEELERKFEELKGNFVQVGKYYGVSDNAIRKWLRYYEKSKGSTG